MCIKLLTKHHLEFLSLKGSCAGSSVSARVKMPLCWKSHALAQILLSVVVDTLFAVDCVKDLCWVCVL